MLAAMFFPEEDRLYHSHTERVLRLTLCPLLCGQQRGIGVSHRSSVLDKPTVPLVL